jgi:ABC-type lipoprotein export system ATPase subunit
MAVALEIRELKKSYVSPAGGRAMVVDVPVFDVKAGEQVALEGESGTGKTTLLNMIAGVLKPDSGSIRLGGTDIAAMGEGARDAFRARHVGYVFQTFNLLQGFSALENVALGMMFGKGADYGFAKTLLERVGLKDYLRHKPRQLSVGQQQRVAVARALANRPGLVLADEPTGNLDHARAAQALSLIREMCRENDATLLLVSHDRGVLGQFERVEKLGELNRASQIPSAQGVGA